MSNFFPQPPPLPMPFTTTVNGGAIPNTATTVITQPQPVDSTLLSNNNNNNNSSPSSNTSSSIIIVIIVIASAIIVSASIYLILRLISRRFHRSYAATDDVVSHSTVTINKSDEEKLLETLPLFKFGSVTGNLTGVDCAVCLSKFEPRDELRLLPLCCHAFHVTCIDAWLLNNQTCPLCRSSVYPTDEEVINKVLAAEAAPAGVGGNDRALTRSGSFRIEIGSISRRRGTSGGSDSSAGNQRSFSIGAFDYIVDDSYEVSVGSVHRRGVSECTDKDSIGAPVTAPPGENIGSEDSRRSWLRDYVDRIASLSLSSRATSFRSSGRFCSSRRSDIVVPVDDLEAGRIGEEISELFRWLSGV